jgi:D-alanyl-D-alanine carboxypeptidase/D-alanyl-D-alanine-endopeptidase (penicillin-binding protein 4)
MTRQTNQQIIWCFRVVFVAAVFVPGRAASVAAGEFEAGGRIAELLTSLPVEGTKCSACVVDLDTGQLVASVNALSPATPASTAKLFVMAAAVDMLGPDFAFRTVLARRGPDLVMIGDGDPAPGDVKVAEARGQEPDAMFARWAEALRARGFIDVPGDLIIDESIFDAEFVHPSWEQGDLKKWFAAPVGALNYNGNCVDVTIWPAAQAGAPVLWESVPRCDLLELVNRCKSGGKGTPLIDRPGDELRYVVTGRCAKRWEFPPIAAPDPGMLTAGALRAALTKRGIKVGGDIVRRRVRTQTGALPPDVQVVAEWVTPLSMVLARTGKHSQNMFAECLMKRLGYEWGVRQGYAAPQGTWSSGREAVNDFLTRIGASTDRVQVADGSGLSRLNRASAADMVAVLSYMHRHPHRKMLVDALSQAGTDGTLAKRMSDVPGVVYAKTGYLRGTRTLGGYVVTPQGRWRGFAVLFNGFKGGAAPYNKIHDEICRILAEDAPSTGAASSGGAAVRR